MLTDIVNAVIVLALSDGKGIWRCVAMEGKTNTDNLNRRPPVDILPLLLPLIFVHRSPKYSRWCASITAKYQTLGISVLSRGICRDQSPNASTFWAASGLDVHVGSSTF
jgi:hypothetical protein